MSESRLAAYDEYAVRHEAAYAAFLKIHESKNPRPAKVEAHRDYISIIIVLALVIVMGAAIFVSSTRTVDEFGGPGIGSLAFIMAEGGLIAFGFFRARHLASKSKLDDSVKLATTGLTLTVVTIIGANLDATLRHKGVILPDAINIGLNVIVALSAPALAFIASDLVAIELMSGDVRRRNADKEYEAKLAEWQEGANRSWASQQRQWGVKIEVSTPVTPVSSVSDTMLPAGKPRKSSPQMQKAITWLTENPGNLETDSRSLESVIGVSHMTIYRAQQKLLVGGNNG